MPNDALEKFIEAFQARREHRSQINKRKPDSQPQTSEEIAQSNREIDERVKASIEGTGTFFKTSSRSTGSNTKSGPGSAFSSSSSHHDMSYLKVPKKDGAETVKIKRPRKDKDKTDQCAKITADNERTRSEAEAAGCEVKDFGTGYVTTESDVEKK